MVVKLVVGEGEQAMVDLMRSTPEPEAQPTIEAPAPLYEPGCEVMKEITKGETRRIIVKVSGTCLPVHKHHRRAVG